MSGVLSPRRSSVGVQCARKDVVIHTAYHLTQSPRDARWPGYTAYAKAGLIELTGDDRAVIFGLLVEAAATLRSEASERQLMLWRRRGQRAFADDLSADATSRP